MPKDNSLKQKRQQNISQLKNVLKADSKKNAKSAEDISEKHQHKSDQSNYRINRYIAISLVKLVNNKTESISYDKENAKEDITARQSSNNELALLNSLRSIHFIKVLNTSTKQNKVIKEIKITSLGKSYVKKYIHHYHRIYQYLKYGKSSMKKN